MASPCIERVHQIQLLPTYEAYLTSLGHDTRRSIRRKTRKLFNNDRPQVVKVTRADQIPALLTYLDEVFQNTWQAKTFGYQRRNTERQIKCFEQIARMGWLRAYVLIYDNCPIAFELGYQYGDTYYRQECGYDQKWADFGPGSVLMHLLIEDLFKENKPSLFDFGFGDALYKHNASNVGYDAASIYIVPANRWRHALTLQSILDAVEVQGRSLLTHIRLDNVVRRILKHRQ